MKKELYRKKLIILRNLQLHYPHLNCDKKINETKDKINKLNQAKKGK